MTMGDTCFCFLILLAALLVAEETNAGVTDYFPEITIFIYINNIHYMYYSDNWTRNQGEASKPESTIHYDTSHGAFTTYSDSFPQENSAWNTLRCYFALLCSHPLGLLILLHNPDRQYPLYHYLPYLTKTWAHPHDQIRTGFNLHAAILEPWTVSVSCLHMTQLLNYIYGTFPWQLIKQESVDIEVTPGKWRAEILPWHLE